MNSRSQCRHVTITNKYNMIIIHKFSTFSSLSKYYSVNEKYKPVSGNVTTHTSFWHRNHESSYYCHLACFGEVYWLRNTESYVDFLPAVVCTPLRFNRLSGGTFRFHLQVWIISRTRNGQEEGGIVNRSEEHEGCRVIQAKNQLEADSSKFLYILCPHFFRQETRRQQILNSKETLLAHVYSIARKL